MVVLSKTAVNAIFKKIGVKATMEAKKEFKSIMERAAKEVAEKSVKIAQKSKRKTVLEKDIKKVEFGEEKKEEEKNGRGQKA